MGIVSFLIYLSIMTGIYAILSLSLNFQYGFAGLVNFGHVAFFCIGAYASSLLVMGGVPLLAGVLGAMIFAGVFGFLISIPTAGLKEDYWAIVTIAAAEIVRLFFLNEAWLAEGAFGIRGIPQPLRALFSTSTYPAFYLGMVLIFLGITYFALRLLTRSPFGRVLKAMREGDDLPRAFGKNVLRFRMKSMAIGAAFAGLAGSLFAHYITFICPWNFMPIETFIIWAMVVVGGQGNHLGAIAGAAIIQVFYVSTRFVKDYIPIEAELLASLRMVIIGLLVVLFMIFRRKGLLEEKKRSYKLSGEE
ncbi:branched-chain amino acid ABC transporter permease [Candidatus Aerophobetes bacterium]|uniref:Branched-chain amino acid ABC transporter permease n=1 Tax=Aerophobetes bacterium TaxID=2030807 RepID=A0A523RPE3_UNCAE|nr:MAG: branched-chain amino acid ABC transporter permease [Candidatus Aerophobetes bacterium]